jgi:DNA (cytosine-5)-methyltransferase 1
MTEHWQEQALCAQVDPGLFFPEQGAPARDAKRVCARCDVREQCLAAALALGADGVWGGTTPRQRQRLGGGVWASATAYLPPPACGTDAAQQRHRRAGQTCTTCGVGTPAAASTAVEDEGYPGGPRALARQLGLTVPGAKQLAYEDVENLAAKAYWKNRFVPGPLCGTQRGYGPALGRRDADVQRVPAGALDRAESQPVPAGGGGVKPRLLDLFCGAGGAAMGYADAGFEVVGVDIAPQPRYPFEFHRGDACTWPLDGFDAVHASPPCQDHSALSSLQDSHGTAWMLEHTRRRVQASGLPYVIENVSGAPMPGALVLCGSEFGLKAAARDGTVRWLKRHRLFESNVDLWGAGGCHCSSLPIGGVYGNGGGRSQTRGYKFHLREGREAMGMAWATQVELSQAIPPAYTEFIGQQLLAAVLERRTAA